MDQAAGKKQALTSFIISIVNLLWFPIWYFIGDHLPSDMSTIPGIFCAITPILAIVLGIIGIVFSKKARNNYCSNAFRILGFIISLIMLIVGAIALTIMFFTFVIAGAVLSEFLGAMFG